MELISQASQEPFSWKSDEKIITTKLVEETEEKKRFYLQQAIDEAYKEVMNSNRICKKMTHFILLFFIKFNPSQNRIRFINNQWRLIDRRLCYQDRITCPLPHWGTTVYIVETDTGKNAPIWSLPNLIKHPLYTLAVSKGIQDRFVVNSIKEKLNGSLKKKALSHNCDPFIEKQYEKLIRQGLIEMK